MNRGGLSEDQLSRSTRATIIQTISASPCKMKPAHRKLFCPQVQQLSFVNILRSLPNFVPKCESELKESSVSHGEKSKPLITFRVKSLSPQKHFHKQHVSHSSSKRKKSKKKKRKKANQMKTNTFCFVFEAAKKLPKYHFNQVLSVRNLK